MARSVIRLEGEEIRYFHINYFYMWKKLNTAPYYVNGSGELPKWIKNPELLPSYVNLSKCMNPEYEPSMNIVNKIVQFYNANITPEITTFQYLHEKLEASDDRRHTGGILSMDKFYGMYYGYYYSGHPEKKEVYGMLIKIHDANGMTGVQLVAGLTDLKDLKSIRLRNLFSGSDVSVEEYKKYKETLDISKRRTTLYKGVFTATQDSVFFQMQGIDHENNWLFYNCASNGSQDENSFLGGMGLMTFINGRYDLQFLKMAIERADNSSLRPFDFTDERLQEMLNINKLPNEHVHLSLQQNSDWNELILENSSSRE